VTRILYLSLSNEKYSSNYFPFLRRYAGAVAAADTELELRGARVGRIDSYRFWESLDTVSILDSVLDGEQRGFDAVAIGNILDPGLREARSMVDIPVLGLGETSMLAACMMGSRFSLVGVNPYFGGCFEENVAKYGLNERLAALEFLSLTPHELDACFSDESARKRAVEAFLSAARSTLDAGSEVVIPAGGRLTAFLNAQGVREVDGAPVLDGTATLIAMTEAAIRVRVAAGTFVSRRRLYARAPVGVIRRVAAEYAESYHLPALRGLAGPETHAAGD
jgi:allantoin racemase